MSAHDLRDYYKRQELEAARHMVAQIEWAQRRSAEEAVEYFRAQKLHYEELCVAASP